MASQALAVTETISSALVFIYYELAKSQETQREVYKEVLAHDGYEELDSLKLLEACIEKGLKFRPLVTLTGSRMVPAGGMDVFGYYLAEGTVITTQSLSMSRQRPDPFPDFDNSTYYADLMKRTALRNGVILSHSVSTLIAAQEKTW
ncbi:CypX Cytochrome P450 [Pyrenophora teres f. maculata]|nr:CypX Cytochrome P450 [Pyrenophora teres f. maculata]